MKNGICPKCGREEVYVKRGQEGWASGSGTLGLNSWKNADLDNYVCGNCGYVECYLPNTASLSYIKKKWSYLQPINSNRESLPPQDWPDVQDEKS